jgi:hypothetical protein
MQRNDKITNLLEVATERFTHLLQVSARENEYGKELGGVHALDAVVSISSRKTEGINHRRSSEGPPAALIQSRDPNSKSCRYVT